MSTSSTFPHILNSTSLRRKKSLTKKEFLCLNSEWEKERLALTIITFWTGIIGPFNRQGKKNPAKNTYCRKPSIKYQAKKVFLNPFLGVFIHALVGKGRKEGITESFVGGVVLIEEVFLVFSYTIHCGKVVVCGFPDIFIRSFFLYC